MSLPEPERVPAAELYRIAVEERRFQVQLNWSRTQYLLAFNAGILAAAVLASRLGGLSALLFGVGAIASALSVNVAHVEHGYYRAARDHMRRVEEATGIPADRRIDTTAALGGRRRPRVNVTRTIYLLLALLCAADVAGVVAVLAR